MSSAARRVAVTVVAGLTLSACGSAVKPTTGSRGRVDDPRTTKNNRVKCIQQARLPVQEVGRTGLQIGPLPAGPTVVFAPTPGAAQAQQIQAEEQGAEAIGSALLYPNQGPDPELEAIEACLAKGVSG
jgi:hypothetical protein